METFKASGLIPRKVEATFILHYEELLRRRLGKYQYTVSIRPQQLVGKLHHPTPPPSTMVGQTKTLAKVTFSPNLVQQAKIARNGMLGDFTIRYDVNRELSVGEVQTKALKWCGGPLPKLDQLCCAKPSLCGELGAGEAWLVPNDAEL
ncbi:hypothetical protein Chor_013163 [Crotalus horridus]